MFKTIMAIFFLSFMFATGYGFGVLSEPPKQPRECKVVKIDYFPERDEPKHISWGWER